MVDLFQNLIDLFGPNERFWIFVIDSNKFFDRRNQLRNALEDASRNSLARDFTKPPLDQVQPRGTRRGKMQMELGMLLKPFLHIRMIVRPVVVQDQVEVHPLRRLPVNLAQKQEKLLISMTRVTGANDGAVEHIECSKQTGGSIAFVVMRHGPASTLLHRQPGLRPVQRLHCVFSSTHSTSALSGGFR